MSSASTHSQPEASLAAPQSERRASQRRTAALEVACGRVADGMNPCLPGKVHDVSAGGFGLLLCRPFAPGTVLVVKVKDKEGGPSTLFARVIHCRAQSRIEWFTGCAFASPLDDLELQALLT